MLRIEFRTAPNGVLEEVYGRIEPATLELNSVLGLGDAEWLTFLTVTECQNGPGSAIRSLENVELLYEQPTVVGSNTSSIVAVVSDAGAFLPRTLATLRAVPHTIRLQDRAVTGVVTVRDWDHLRTVANDIERTHDGFELVSVTQADRVGSLLGTDNFRQTLRSRLTESQIELLETAHRMGYFVVPREASANEVAARLGVSQSTFSERLRRAVDDLLAVGLGREPRVADEE